MKNNIRRRILSLALAVVMVVGVAGLTALGAPVYSDIEGHWGEAAIEKWSGYDVLHGNGDGTFSPDTYMTAEELATVLANAFGYTAKYEGELPGYDGTWGEDAVRQAIAAGALEVGEASAELTRELAAKVIAKALHIAPVAGSSKFADDYAIGAAYQPYVNALGRQGVFNGNPDGSFAPSSGFKRAEVMQVLDNTIGDIVKESVPAEYDKIVIVNAGGVTLTEGTVDGDLIIAQGVGDGDITLDSVAVTGRLVVFGGGANSIHIKGKSDVPVVVVDKTFGQPARISVEGADAVVGTVAIAAESKAIVATTDGATIGSVTTEPAVAVTAEGEIEVAAAEVKTEVTIAAAVENVAINSDNAAVTVASGAAIESLVIEGDGAAVTVASGATVQEATVSASDVTISGSGKVENVTVTEDSIGNVAVTTPGTTVENNSDASVSLGGGKTVAPDQSATTSTGGSGSTGGGGVVSGPQYAVVEQLVYPFGAGEDIKTVDEDGFAAGDGLKDNSNINEHFGLISGNNAVSGTVTVTQAKLEAKVLGSYAHDGAFSRFFKFHEERN
jgi:hypothetical protein